MEKIEFEQVTVDKWQLIEEIEKSAASVLFSPFDGEEGYKKYIKESKVYLIMDKDKTIGTVSYKIKDDGTIHINRLTVLPDYRRKGVATKAMKKLLKDLGDKNYALLVHPENTPAIMIYLRLGFIVAEWKDNLFGDGQPRLYLKRDLKK